MRIRHRQRHEEQYGAEEINVSLSHAPGTVSMYLHHTEKGTYTLFGQDDYEPIPETRWVDVTGQCSLNDDGTTLWMGREAIGGMRDQQYRLVAEQLWRIDHKRRVQTGTNADGSLAYVSNGSIPLEPVDALRIERKGE